MTVLVFAAAGCGSDESGSDDGSSASASEWLVINEVAADAADGGNDWIELFVIDDDSAEAVDLGDYSLSDESGEVSALPAVSLNPGEYLIMYASGDAGDSDYSLSFKLGSSDSVSLLFNGSATGTSLSWEKDEAAIGYSYGLFPNGSGSAQSLAPTKGAANEELPSSSSLIINEILAADVSGGNDWIELYASEDTDLSNYSLVDEDGSAQSLPEISVSAGSYTVIYAAEDDPGSYYVPFKLGGNDAVTLLYNGTRIDYMDWDSNDATAGFSFGCLPDASGGNGTLTPTQGAVNESVPDSFLVINEIVSNASGDGDDWFELYVKYDNEASTTVSISNYSIMDDSGAIVALSDVITDASSFSSGDYILIYATDTDPGSYYLSSFKLGSNDSLTLLYNSAGVDFLEWDSGDAPEDYSYGLLPDGSGDADTLSPTPGAANAE
ncbi:MAG: lamin tail domain-containing protein [bacterium]|nr:lamin tail domain-containing protein [bacterium]